MRSTIGFLAAAGIGLSAMAARADSSFSEAPFVGTNWDKAPQAAPQERVLAGPVLPVSGDAFVGTRWSDTPSSEAASTATSPAPASRSRSLACACR